MCLIKQFLTINDKRLWTSSCGKGNQGLENGSRIIGSEDFIRDLPGGSVEGCSDSGFKCSWRTIVYSSSNHPFYDGNRKVFLTGNHRSSTLRELKIISIICIEDKVEVIDCRITRSPWSGTTLGNGHI